MLGGVGVRACDVTQEESTPEGDNVLSAALFRCLMSSIGPAGKSPGDTAF